MEKIFDVMIVGGGVAGMSAAIYAKRAGKEVAIIEKMTLGGTVGTLNKIKNFPSQMEVDGATLADMFAKQVKSFDIEILFDEIVGARLTGEVKILTGRVASYKAKSVIIATGLSYVQLGVNEEEFLGRGVSYCATCDANFFKGQTVCVVSRGGKGVMDAKYLSNIVSKVILLDEGDVSALAKVNTIKNVEFVSNAKVQKVIGKEAVEAIECLVDGKKKKIPTKAVFVNLGRKPKADIFGKELEVDAAGFIKTDERMKTSVDGVYAIGDVRNGVLKQIVTACSDGAIAGRGI